MNSRIKLKLREGIEEGEKESRENEAGVIAKKSKPIKTRLRSVFRVVRLASYVNSFNRMNEWYICESRLVFVWANYCESGLERFHLSLLKTKPLSARLQKQLIKVLFRTSFYPREMQFIG